MSDYTYPQTAFTLIARDGLPPGNPEKTVKGVQLDPEFVAIAAASATKLNSANPTFTGLMTGGTFSIGTIDGGTF